MSHRKLFGSGGRRSADGPVGFVEALESRLCLSGTTVSAAAVSAHQVHAAHVVHVAHVTHVEHVSHASHVRHVNHLETVQVPISTSPDFAKIQAALFRSSLD
jgi:hypothetical protein